MIVAIGNQRRAFRLQSSTNFVSIALVFAPGSVILHSECGRVVSRKNFSALNFNYFSKAYDALLVRDVEEKSANSPEVGVTITCMMHVLFNRSIRAKM